MDGHHPAGSSCGPASRIWARDRLQLWNYFTDTVQARGHSSGHCTLRESPIVVPETLCTFKSDAKGRGKVMGTLTEHERWVGEVMSFSNEVSPDFNQAADLWEVSDGIQATRIALLVMWLKTWPRWPIGSSALKKCFYSLSEAGTKIKKHSLS